MTPNPYPTDTESALMADLLTVAEIEAGSMNASMLDGYLAALASGPNLDMPDQMLRWVVAADDKWNTAEVRNLIMRRFQAINDALNDRVYVATVDRPASMVLRLPWRLRYR